MGTKTMHTSAFGSLMFAAALASTWIGCVTDVTPQKGAEKTGETSAALAGPPYGCPDAASAYWNVAYAKPHSPGFIIPPGQNNYTDVAPTPCSNPGLLFSCSAEPGSDIHTYEEDVFNYISTSNGYEYKVNIPSFHNQDYYVGVGINRATGGWSSTPPLPPGHFPGGGPSLADFDEEKSLVSNNPPNTSFVNAHDPALKCVAVYAEDTGALLDTFVLMDVHDPDKGNGW